MNQETFKSDIPLSLATQAHEGTSFEPDRRGRQHQDEYAQTMQDAYQTLRMQAEQGGTLDQLDEQFARFRNGYRTRYTKWLNTKSRCMSVMIAGPSNFPSRRNAKMNAIEHRRCQELVDFHAAGIKAAISNLRPDLRPIMSGDANATDRLAEKITAAEERQTLMRGTNAAIRKHAKDGPEAQIRALTELGHEPRIAEELLKPDYAGRIGYADYELTNNNANLRRMKERLEIVSRNQSKPDTTHEGDLARIEDCPAENRIRLFFPDKPNAETRTALKSSGFRWAPSVGAWQSYRNMVNLDRAKKFAGVPCA